MSTREREADQDAPSVVDVEPGDYPGRDEVREYFASRAAVLDRHEDDIRPGLRMLGERGLLDLGAPNNAGGALPGMVRLVEDVASECLSSGFSLWAHRMVLEYLSSRSDRPAAAAELPGLRAGTRVGVTAMAPAIRQLAGLEPVPVEATRTSDGVRLTGPISWASNLFDDALVVVPARLPEGGGIVAQIRIGDPGVSVNPAPSLLALQSTASSSMKLEDVAVPADAVLSEDLTAFVRSFRPTFLLVQSAFCSGLALAARTAATGRMTGVNAEFEADFADLEGHHDSVRQRLFDYARAPERPGPRQLLQLRLDAARVAGGLTRVEAAVRGGAGYVASSPTGRRQREAAFLPIQAPPEGQLRWELSRSE